jgi:hypothetical protein
MGQYTKSGLPFLYDSVTGRIVGIKNSDNSEFNLSTSPIDVHPTIYAKWADRPTAPTLNQQIVVTDLMMSTWYWNNFSWRPSGGAVKLKAVYGSNAQPVITITGNGTDQGIDLLSIPAGLIPHNSAIRISLMAKRLNGATALTNLNIRLGPTTSISDQAVASLVVGASGGFSYGGSQVQFDNNGAVVRQNYQLSQGSATNPNMVIASTDQSSIDRTISQRIKLWMTSDWAVGNDVAIYSIEIDLLGAY